MYCGVVNKAYIKESEEFSQNVMQQVNRPVENVMHAAVSTRQYVNCGEEGNLDRCNDENRSLNLTVKVREVKRGKFSPKNDMDENKMQCQSARLLYTAASNSSENKTDSQPSSDQKVSFQVDENGKISDSTFIEHNDEINQFSSRNLNNVKRIYVRGIAEINRLIEKGQIRHEAMKGLLKDTKFAFLKPSFISTYKDPLQKPHPYFMMNEYVPTLTSPACTVHEDIVLSIPPTNTLIRETVTSPTDSQQAMLIRTVSETTALANFDFTTTKDALNKCLNTGTVITVAGTAGSTKSTNRFTQVNLGPVQPVILDVTRL